MRKDDTALIEDVIEQLKADPAINSSHINFAVHNGVITLGGTVPSYWQKMEAEHAVWRVLGVQALANELRVELSGTHVLDDTDIASSAIAVLRSHSELPATIEATVHNGFVTLTGKVDWDFQRTAAEKAIMHLRGVNGVCNEIQLNCAPTVSDVRDRIRTELTRTLDRELNHIDIQTSDGDVTLSGTVQSLSEAAAARRAAWAVPGVKDVKDLLTIT
ncbi:MAG: BON domain-containing protein [Mycobacterium sp.]|nr:BON domain-containing protein [Mycobacterium sp.]